MEMPKFGFVTPPGEDIIKGITRTGEIGLDFVEILLQEPAGVPQMLMKRKHEIKTALEKSSIIPLAHAPWKNDFGSLHENVRKAWVDETKLMLDFGNEIGLQKMNLHAFFSPENLRQEKARQAAIENNIQSLIEITDYASNYEIGIVVENIGPPVRFSDYQRVLDEVRKAKVTVDTGHAFIEGGMELLLKYIETFRNRINHIHFHDNHGKDDNHLHIGKGLIDYKRVVAELRKINFKETVTLETFPESPILISETTEKIKAEWEKST